MQRQKSSVKMEVYNEVENDAGNVYLYDATAETAGQEHEQPG